MNISQEYRCKNLQQTSADQIQQCIKIMHYTKWDLFQIYKSGSVLENQCNPPHQQAKEEN
jgi:hypothetical protein